MAMLEALLALLVVCAGLALTARHQSRLRLHVEQVREEIAALHLAQAGLEVLRAAPAADPTGPGPDETPGDVDAAGYAVERFLGPMSAPGAHAARVTVGWIDRDGRAQQIALDSILAVADPAHSGALGLARGGAFGRGGPTAARARGVPVGAVDLGDGRSAWKPVETGSVALLFDNLDGSPIGRCDVDPTLATRDLDAGRLGDCTTLLRGRLLSGVVRFSDAVPPDPTHAVDPPRAFDIELELGRGDYPQAPACATQPVAGPGTERYTAWHCLVLPRADGRWSGRATLVPRGWRLGQTPGTRRVCRYVVDLDGSGAIDANAEHPADYIDAADNLQNQNFLVIDGSADCPGPVVTTGRRGPGNNGGSVIATEKHQP